jgi:hypothetical protein
LAFGVSLYIPDDLAVTDCERETLRVARQRAEVHHPVDRRPAEGMFVAVRGLRSTHHLAAADGVREAVCAAECSEVNSSALRGPAERVRTAGGGFCVAHYLAVTDVDRGALGEGG